MLWMTPVALGLEKIFWRFSPDDCLHLQQSQSALSDPSPSKHSREAGESSISNSQQDAGIRAAVLDPASH